MRASNILIIPCYEKDIQCPYSGNQIKRPTQHILHSTCIGTRHVRYHLSSHNRDGSNRADGDIQDYGQSGCKGVLHEGL